MEIPYEIVGEKEECITPCPHGMRYEQFLFNVGSLLCQECTFFSGGSREDNIVYCGYDKFEELKEEAIDV